MVIVGLLAMIVLGILSAALSYRKKNYYLRVFDDIIGREEDDRVTVKLGRAFLYGFLFPIYFALALGALVALIVFLVNAGIIAAIIFILVWATEKIVPHEWFGALMLTILEKLGFAGAAQPAAPSTVSPTPVQPSKPASIVTEEEARSEQKPSASPLIVTLEATQPSEPDIILTEKEAKAPEKDDPSNPFPGGGINRTRTHKLD